MKIPVSPAYAGQLKSPGFPLILLFKFVEPLLGDMVQFGVRNEVGLWDQTTGAFVGRADLTNGAYVWEIKPANPAGMIAGDEQLARYTNNTGYSLGGDLPGLKVNDQLYLKGDDGNMYHYANVGHVLVVYEIIKGPSSWETMVDTLKNLGSAMSKMFVLPPCGCGGPRRPGALNPGW